MHKFTSIYFTSTWTMFCQAEAPPPPPKAETWVPVGGDQHVFPVYASWHILGIYFAYTCVTLISELELATCLCAP